ncbi:MAG TPA: glutathione S-transferase family protein [Kofleriaceae bacterium]
MKLYHHPLSPNCSRVSLTAAVLGLDLEHQLVDFSKGEHKAPAFLAINPNGALPALVDGDFALTESRAIMQYLASKKPEAGLLPRDERGRAEVTRWQFWDASHWSPALSTIAFERVMKGMMGMGAADEAKVQENLKSFRRWAAVLDGALAGKQYLVGNTLTVADLTLASSLRYAKQSEVPLAEFGNIESWFGRITALDGWKETSV